MPFGSKEDESDAKKETWLEEIVAKLRQVDVYIARTERGGGDPLDRGYRGDILSLAPVDRRD